MLAYCLYVAIEQYRQLLPVEPYGLVFQTHLKSDFVVGLVQDDFSFFVQPKRK